MYDELTRADLQKMQEEIDYRVQQLRPKLIEDVQTARAFGDLSENFEYKCAKQEKNRNDARIRYLQRMIKTARVIEDRSAADTAGLYDTVEIFMENLGKSRKIQLVTTLRQDALKGWISKESPVGRAVMGRKAGDRVYVDMGSGKGYYLQIRAIEIRRIAQKGTKKFCGCARGEFSETPLRNRPNGVIINIGSIWVVCVAHISYVCGTIFRRNLI